jgi:SAM-dependent methyltransferase
MHHRFDANNIHCPVCGGACSFLDVVDFNKSCEEVKGNFLKLVGIPVYYVHCGDCSFCFAPEFADWTLTEFEKKIYNNDYYTVDHDYIDVRPRANAATIMSMFGKSNYPIRHLDYGGGSGVLVRILKESSFDSISYDPFVDRQVEINQLGKFDLITAFEVFEHVPDVKQLMTDLNSLLSPDGIVLFSTLLSDGNIKPNQRLLWWYASPRNGHISLFSKKSLTLLADDFSFKFGSFSVGFHVFFRNIPSWASHIIS